MRWWLLAVLLVEATATECPGVCACAGHVMDCSSRSLTQVPTEGISPHTTWCHLSHNNLSTLGHDTLRAFAHVTAVDLSHNQLVHVSGTAFSHMAHVVSIDLTGNNITHIEFKHMKSTHMYALYLSHNPSLRLPEHGFELRPLKILEMKHCGLSHIPGHFFAHAQKLEVLFLEGNRFSSMDSHTFSRLKYLVFLDLSGNKFTTLPSGLLRHLNMAVRINLDENPFVCECKTRDEYANYVTHRGHGPLHCSFLGAGYHFTAFYREHCDFPGSPSEDTPPRVVEVLPSGSPAHHRGAVVAATLSALLVAAVVVIVVWRLRRKVRLHDTCPQRFSILKVSDEV